MAAISYTTSLLGKKMQSNTVFTLSPLQKISFPLLCIALFLLCSWLYTNAALLLAGRDGVYPSPEEGMLARIDRNYSTPYEVELAYAGTNSFDGSNPHVQYVIACVWADRRIDGSPVGSVRHAYDQPGSFFLSTKDGWVWMPEGAFPTFIGFWMKIFGLAGSSSSQPSHPMESRGRCVF